MWWKKKKSPEGNDSTQPPIVMVDDESDLCDIVRLTLSPLGYDFAAAHDGESGLALIRERRPSLVILDIKMPRMNGFEMLARLQQDPCCAEIPVIVLTSVTEASDTPDEEWARKLGVRRLISKPTDAADIFAAVREILTTGTSPENPVLSDG